MIQTNQRPQIAVGALIVQDDSFVLIKRAKEPSKGKWALPGGRVEWGETMVQAVTREVLEETGLAVTIGEIITIFDALSHDENGAIPFHYVIVDFLAWPQTENAPLIPGDDAEAVGWFTVAELDALPVTSTTARLVKGYFERKEVKLYRVSG